MTSSYAKATLRKYQKDHPWARKLPKSMMPKRRCREDMPIDLGVLELTDEYGDSVNSEAEAIRVGDGSWAIVYDESREGEWLWELADNGWVNHVCSECKYKINTDFHVVIDLPRCPRCGANMTKTHGIRFEDDRICVY